MRLITLAIVVSFSMILLISNSTNAIPTMLVANDDTGDVVLTEADYGNYNEGDIVNDPILDILKVQYDYDDTLMNVFLTMFFTENVVFGQNNSLTHGITVNINRYEDYTTPLVEASLSAVRDGGTSTGSMRYLYDNGTTETLIPTLTTTATQDILVWVFDVSTFPVAEIFDVNNTQVLLEGFAEFYPGATTGSTNAKFVDEVRTEWPSIPENPDNGNQSPLSVEILTLIAIPVLAVIYRRNTN